MTEYQNTVINPAAPWSFIPDTEENILHDLGQYALDPIFELYGDFVNPAPEWLDPKAAAKYAGCASIFGNFLTHSHAFRLVTDDAGLISRISAAVKRNKARPEYQAAYKKMISKLPILTKQNAKPGEHYAFASGWVRVTRVYRLAEQEANEKCLLYLDRFDGVTRDGPAIGAVLPGSDMIPTAKNWRI